MRWLPAGLLSRSITLTILVYKGGDNGVFAKNAKTTLFNRVVFTTDEITDDWKSECGVYYIVLWAQAIQAYGFNDADTAISNLSNDFIATDLDAVVNN